jgi:hypothetical protein
MLASAPEGVEITETGSSGKDQSPRDLAHGHGIAAIRGRDGGTAKQASRSAHEPEAHKPEAHEPEAHESEAHKPEAHKPEA